MHPVLAAAMALQIALLPSAIASAIIKTSEATEQGQIRITYPQDGAILPAGDTIEIDYEAVPGFKGRYVQLQLNDETPVVLEERKGSHSFPDIEPGRHTVKAKLLNPAHADLGIEDSVTFRVEPTTDKERTQ